MNNKQYQELFVAGARIVGIGFILIGMIVALSGAVQRDWIMFGAALVVVVLGFLLILAKPR